MTADLAQWWEYSPTTEEVAGSMRKHLCERTFLFVLGLGISMYNIYVIIKKIYKYVFIRFLEYI
jgi:hypothetical protein